jgi:hypothetical protein
MKSGFRNDQNHQKRFSKVWIGYIDQEQGKWLKTTTSDENYFGWKILRMKATSNENHFG